MYYAPVLIPTLNRFEHLKRLIESLQKNSYAQFTELYISVDYPPAEKYFEGYKKICEYLKSPINGFKTVNIIKQEKNLGVFKNIDFLYFLASEKYDRCIFTEDDNEFSPNFLEYMDKGLELIKNNDHCLGLTGFNIPVLWDNSNLNVIPCYWLNYGSGYFFNVQSSLKKKYSYSWFYNKFFSISSLLNLYKTSKLMFNIYLRGLLCRKDPLMFDNAGNLRFIDTVQTLLMILDNKYYIAPVLSLSRNWGYDGSGENMGNDNRFQKYPIDTNTSFDFVLPESFKMTKKNKRIFGKEFMLYDTKFMDLHILKNLVLFLLKRKQLKKEFCE